MALKPLPGVSEGPQSYPWENTGEEWLNQRMDAQNVDIARSAEDSQRRLSQLGDTSWDNDLRMDHDYTVAAKNEQPMAAKNGRSITHLYRGMSDAEFDEAKGRGFIQSDQRGVIDDSWEGTNAALNPKTASYYMPNEGSGRIVKMKVLNPDQWFASRDAYARTRDPIPWDSVVAHTESYSKWGGPSMYADVVAEQKAAKERGTSDG